MTDSIHDPLARHAEIHRLLQELLGDEPYFLLLARDELSDGLTAEWAALKGRRIEAVPDIVKNLVVTSGNLPFHPTKDSEHVQSARQISNAMRIWRYKNKPRMPTNSRAVDLSAVFPETDAHSTSQESRTPIKSGIEIYKIGERIILTQPVHFRASDPNGNALNPLDPIGQLVTGTAGTVRGVNLDDRQYLTGIDGQPDGQSFVVPFDRCTLEPL